MKRYLGKYIVRWTDNEGKRHKKEYDDYTLAQKALRWLAKSGVTDADVAISKPQVESKDT